MSWPALLVSCKGFCSSSVGGGWGESFLPRTIQTVYVQARIRLYCTINISMFRYVVSIPRLQTRTRLSVVTHFFGLRLYYTINICMFRYVVSIPRLQTGTRLSVVTVAVLQQMTDTARKLLLGTHLAHRAHVTASLVLVLEDCGGLVSSVAESLSHLVP
ncbi:hypothetical protein J6590_102591 [Homalodisca vitripennis]|nr:hypothetical protein J6590_102591 [Homalodisca vitripennis]